MHKLNPTVAGIVGALVRRLRERSRRRAATHEAWLRGILDSDREISLMDGIHRHPSPQPERHE
ncbi:hypothetical protein ABH931_002833 [Streptacidiphilus sp. MAP12-33]|uniref:hypothetical protein n=1 Tax=Streptacidiphilus sp. MAP12-33 TaxID=3156266 RepID=UPI003519A831